MQEWLVYSLYICRSGSYCVHAEVGIVCMLTFIVCMHAVHVAHTYIAIYLYARVAQLLCMHAEVAHKLSCSSSSFSMYMIHAGVAI